MFLITGFPRSGTQYISRCLRRFGYGIGEEQIFPHSHGVVSWKHAPEHKKFSPVAYQMRNPVNTIASAQTIPIEDYFNYIWPHIEMPKDHKDPLKRAIHAWPRWYNKFAKGYVYKIEQVEEVYPELFEHLGLKPPEKWTKQVPTNQNTREYEKIEFKDIYEIDEESAKMILQILQNK